MDGSYSPLDDTPSSRSGTIKSIGHYGTTSDIVNAHAGGGSLANESIELARGDAPFASTLDRPLPPVSLPPPPPPVAAMTLSKSTSFVSAVALLFVCIVR